MEILLVANKQLYTLPPLLLCDATMKILCWGLQQILKGIAEIGGKKGVCVGVCVRI